MFFFQHVRLIILNIISLLRRLCCFSKRRKVSMQYGGSQEPEMVVVVEGRCKKHDSERDWNTWDDRPRTVEEHIEQYRERIAAPPPQAATVEQDYFKELIPDIKPQPKYYIQTEDSSKGNVAFTRLAAPSIPITARADLEDWEEDNDLENAGWEQLDAAQAKQIIREKRAQSRNKRHETISNKSNVALNAVRLNSSTS